ncbi:hypothetical protein B7494_g1590 [Chlorociboria aeruginascens]|nr:hypothetical protein B7494_g1590 [Chlorociboria aeruginascens]
MCHGHIFNLAAQTFLQISDPETLEFIKALELEIRAAINRFVQEKESSVFKKADAIKKASNALESSKSTLENTLPAFDFLLEEFEAARADLSAYVAAVYLHPGRKMAYFEETCSIQANRPNFNSFYCPTAIEFLFDPKQVPEVTRFMLNDRRNRMKIDTIEALKCLK